MNHVFEGLYCTDENPVNEKIMDEKIMDEKNPSLTTIFKGLKKFKVGETVSVPVSGDPNVPPETGKILEIRGDGELGLAELPSGNDWITEYDLEL